MLITNLDNKFRLVTAMHCNGPLPQVSETQREGLWAAEESMPALLEKAGLAGAKFLLLFICLGVDFEEEPALVLSNSVIKYK